VRSNRKEVGLGVERGAKGRGCQPTKKGKRNWAAARSEALGKKVNRIVLTSGGREALNNNGGRKIDTAKGRRK